MQEQDKNKDNINSTKDEEIKIVIDETGSFSENLCKPSFGYLLLGVLAVTITVFLGIFVAIKILDATDEIPNILTNKYGVVINAEPEKQVCYFLLNSAQYWAETGIHVEKGDLVSVYASGSINTGIHHVVAAANDNIPPDFDWSGPEGLNTKVLFASRPADRMSLHYLVQPDENHGALLMMIQEDENAYKQYIKPENTHLYFQSAIVTIGEGKSKIRINENGLLYFCVNEVFLSKRNIEELRAEYIEYIQTHPDTTFINADKFEEFKQAFVLDSQKRLGTYGVENATRINIRDSLLTEYVKRCEKGDSLAPNHKKLLKVYDRIFELESYYTMKYANPWYDDNLGSYLVVVEIEKRKKKKE